MNKTYSIPKEFDIRKTGVGYTMKGWDFSSAEIEDALQHDRMLNPAFELARNTCPWSCFFCFTEEDNPHGCKKELPGEMSLEEKISLVDQAADLGTHSINIVGAGEPTIDPNFFRIIEHIDSKGIIPIIYTEGSLRLKKPDFAKRVYDANATVVLKVNSLENEHYQNSVVNGGFHNKKTRKVNYFEERNKALEVLIDTGFNTSDPTRLAFDTIICKENYDEIERIHRFARDNNIFTLFVNYLPSGRSEDMPQNAVSRDKERAMYKKLAEIDRTEYGLPEHAHTLPYAGGVPCSIRGLGIYIKIQGEVWDCPGTLERIEGNVKKTPLAELWEKTAYIRKNFDGGCLPKDLFYKTAEKV